MKEIGFKEISKGNFSSDSRFVQKKGRLYLEEKKPHLFVRLWRLVLGRYDHCKTAQCAMKLFRERNNSFYQLVQSGSSDVGYRAIKNVKVIINAIPLKNKKCRQMRIELSDSLKALEEQFIKMDLSYRDAEFRKDQAAAMALSAKKAEILKAKEAEVFKAKEVEQLKAKEAEALKAKEAEELKAKEAEELKAKEAEELKAKEAEELKENEAKELDFQETSTKVDDVGIDLKIEATAERADEESKGTSLEDISVSTTFAESIEKEDAESEQTGWFGAIGSNLYQAWEKTQQLYQNNKALVDGVVIGGVRTLAGETASIGLVHLYQAVVNPNDVPIKKRTQHGLAALTCAANLTFKQAIKPLVNDEEGVMKAEALINGA